MPLTPYEFGRETGRLQAQIHPEISNERVEHLASVLYLEEGKTEFLEGYRNGFTEAKAAQIPNPSWLPNEDEIAEAEREMLELEESLQAGKEVAEDETRTLKSEMRMLESPTWTAYLKGALE